MTTYFTIHEWLAGFHERISVNPFAFVLVDLTVLIAATLTVPVLTIRAASANPAKSLRN